MCSGLTCAETLIRQRRITRICFWESWTLASWLLDWPRFSPMDLRSEGNFPRFAPFNRIRLHAIRYRKLVRLISQRVLPYPRACFTSACFLGPSCRGDFYCPSLAPCARGTAGGFPYAEGSRFWITENPSPFRFRLSHWGVSGCTAYGGERIYDAPPSVLLSYLAELFDQ